MISDSSQRLTPNSRAARPALISPNRSNSITKASCAFRLAWAMCYSDTPVTATVNLTSISGAVISLALRRDRSIPLYNISNRRNADYYKVGMGKWQSFSKNFRNL